MSNQELEQEILKLENDVKRLEDSTKEIIQSIKERIQNLKDIAWDRQSKKESSQMYKVLKEEKESTQVKSNIGEIKVDKDFMEKEIRKHLDNPNLRGMVTTEEMLSFPKVAKNVEAEIDKKHNNFTWKVKANNESILAYGSREYEKDNKNVNRLLTVHSKTESNQRMAEVDRRGHPYHSIFNDFNFRKSANNAIIPQPKEQAKQNPTQNQTNFDANVFSNLSPTERLVQLQANQESISQMPKVSEILKKDSNSLQNPKEDKKEEDSNTKESKYLKTLRRHQ